MAVTNRHRRFTIYDMMEAKGLFEINPANTDSRDSDGNPLYKGPVEYPKMFYHPKGEERIVTPAEVIVTPLGPKMVNEHREIITQVAANAAEEEALRADGWWDHPAKAIAAGGGIAPAVSSDTRIRDLEAQIAKLQAERNNEGAKALRNAGPSRTVAPNPPSGDPFAPAA